MNTKQPTPQGISALLRKAGFEKSVITNNSRHHKEHTAGFHVYAFLGDVHITWWHDSTAPDSDLAVKVQEHIETGREMRARYAEAVAAAGWAVDEKLHSLIVTSSEG